MRGEPARTRWQGWACLRDAKGLFRDNEHMGLSQQPCWQSDHATEDPERFFSGSVLQALGLTCLERGKLRRDSQIDHILKGAEALSDEEGATKALSSFPKSYCNIERGVHMTGHIRTFSSHFLFPKLPRRPSGECLARSHQFRVRDRDSVLQGCSPAGRGRGGAGRRNKAKGTSSGEHVGVPRPTEPEFWQTGRGRRPDEAGAARLASLHTKGGAPSWTFESDVFKAKTE